LRRKHRGYGDTFFIDEVFVKINGKQHYLWIRTVKWLMYSFRLNGMGLQQSGSSNVYCVAMAASPGRS